MLDLALKLLSGCSYCLTGTVSLPVVPCCFFCTQQSWYSPLIPHQQTHFYLDDKHALDFVSYIDGSTWIITVTVLQGYLNLFLSLE